MIVELGPWSWLASDDLHSRLSRLSAAVKVRFHTSGAFRFVICTSCRYGRVLLYRTICLFVCFFLSFVIFQSVAYLRRQQSRSRIVNYVYSCVCLFFPARCRKKRCNSDHQTWHRNVSRWVLETHLFWGQKVKVTLLRLPRFLSSLLLCLFTSIRIGPFRFQAGGRKRWRNLALDFCVYFVL